MACSQVRNYLTTLDWIRRADNLCLVGPAGTGKTHYLIAIGRSAIEAGHRVRYYSAIELVETLWRGQADNTVGKTIEAICRNDLIIIDEVGCAPRGADGSCGLPAAGRRSDRLNPLARLAVLGLTSTTNGWQAQPT